ncbi:MAG TPA: SRPBCC domain-containing protein [Polyangiaceae bacterium]|nr:SRPBCC domain-containing protein [Polyangiaceae bacterium]
MVTLRDDVSFGAPPRKIYEALVNLERFGRITGAPASGDATEGSAFSAFGGHITGRHVELVPDQRVVQAWRAKTWPEGTYSIVRFELRAEGDGTKLSFQHDGFPEDQAEHLAQGWKANYWENLAKHVT